jgi:hypothetical protein
MALRIGQIEGALCRLHRALRRHHIRALRQGYLPQLVARDDAGAGLYRQVPQDHQRRPGQVHPIARRHNRQILLQKQLLGLFQRELRGHRPRRLARSRRRARGRGGRLPPDRGQTQHEGQ